MWLFVLAFLIGYIRGRSRRNLTYSNGEVLVEVSSTAGRSMISIPYQETNSTLLATIPLHRIKDIVIGLPHSAQYLRQSKIDLIKDSQLLSFQADEKIDLHRFAADQE